MKNKFIISITISLILFKTIKECYSNNNVNIQTDKEISNDVSIQTDKEISNKIITDDQKFIIINKNY